MLHQRVARLGTFDECEGALRRSGVDEVGRQPVRPNSWGYANPKVDAALATAITTRDEAERKAAYDLVQRIAADEEPCLTIAHYGVNVAMRPGITNYTFNPIAHDYMLDPQMTLAR